MKLLHSLVWTMTLALTQAIAGAQAQQIPDRDADVAVAAPAFEGKPRPIVAIDEAHGNFHTMEHRFAPFAALLQNDGFQVSATDVPFSVESLHGIDILVIANALNTANINRWAMPVLSAFTADEIAAVKEWVDHGGSLLLIADHFPFAGAASDLAAAFGFEFVNGFALAGTADGVDVFTSQSGTLRDDIMTRGRNESEQITELATFTGSAFSSPADARPLIVLHEGFVLLLPTVAWQFDEQTPRHSGAGYLQGATMNYGKGRIAVFAEAGMFTAQRNELDPDLRIGFNTPQAKQNKQFILNTMRWLARALPE